MKKRNLLLILTVFISCDPGDDRLIIVNNTNNAIVVADRIWVKDPSMYLKDKVAIDNFDFEVNQIEPKSSLKMTRKDNWENDFIENDTVVFLIFDRDSIIKKRLEKFNENYNIKKIIYVSKRYIKSNNWTLKIDTINKKIIKL